MSLKCHISFFIPFFVKTASQLVKPDNFCGDKQLLTREMEIVTTAYVNKGYLKITDIRANLNH